MAVAARRDSAPTIVIAGAASGVGKTTIATGVMAALARRGLRVQPFKAGPDYIDPSYHSFATGVPSRNLDTWMLMPEALVELFHRAVAGKDIAVVEGVMGLYDGRAGRSEEGSTAQLAKLLDAPVVLVVDAGGMGRSVAAAVLGYKSFDKNLKLAGVILNNVGSAGHRDHTIPPIEEGLGIPVLGAFPRQPELRLPERHLGLIPTLEGRTPQEFLERLVASVEQHIALDRLVKLAKEHWRASPSPAPRLFPASPQPKRVAIAVARDRAFSFYYQDSLDLLEAWGAEIVPFSPLSASAIPRDASGVYLGGGFPELFAGELSANVPMLASIGKAAASGTPVYAECGGLMCLGTRLVDLEGHSHEMAGVFDATSTMTGSRLTLGYRTVRALRDTPLCPQGTEVRGHEFHWSTLDHRVPKEEAAYEVQEQTGRTEGFLRNRCLATYVHLHFGARPDLAPHFVNVCAEWREGVNRG